MEVLLAVTDKFPFINIALPYAVSVKYCTAEHNCSAEKQPSAIFVPTMFIINGYMHAEYPNYFMDE